MRLPAAVAAFLMLSHCGSAPFEGMWAHEKSSPLVTAGTKVLVLAVNLPNVVEMGAEAGVAEELRRIGMNAVPAYQIFDAAKGENAKSAILREKFQMAVVVRATNDEAAIYSGGKSYKPAARNPVFWSWMDMRLASDAQPAAAQTAAYVEMLVYTLGRDQLVWAGVSTTASELNVAATSRSLAETAVYEMRKAGLIAAAKVRTAL